MTERERKIDFLTEPKRLENEELLELRLAELLSLVEVTGVVELRCRDILLFSGPLPEAPTVVELEWLSLRSPPISCSCLSFISSSYLALQCLDGNCNKTQFGLWEPRSFFRNGYNRDSSSCAFGDLQHAQIWLASSPGVASAKIQFLCSFLR